MHSNLAAACNSTQHRRFCTICIGYIVQTHTTVLTCLAVCTYRPRGGQQLQRLGRVFFYIFPKRKSPLRRAAPHCPTEKLLPSDLWQKRRSSNRSALGRWSTETLISHLFFSQTAHFLLYPRSRPIEASKEQHNSCVQGNNYCAGQIAN